MSSDVAVSHGAVTPPSRCAVSRHNVHPAHCTLALSDGATCKAIHDKISVFTLVSVFARVPKFIGRPGGRCSGTLLLALSK